MGYRDTPSKLAYHGTTWANFVTALGKTFHEWFGSILIGGMVMLFATALYMIASAEADDARCEVQCNPHAAKVMDDDCYCLPADAPAFRSEGGV